MRKIILAIIVMSACNPTDNKKENNFVSDIYTEDSLRLEPTNFDRMLHDKAMIYADSMNNSDIKSLPKFLYDEDFDYRDTFLLTGGTFHAEHYSLRIEIFKNVSKKDVLEYIANDSFFVNQFTENRKTKPTKRFNLRSNSDIARLRLWEINNSKDTLNVFQ